MSSWKGKTKGGVTGYSIFLFLLKNFSVQSAYLLLYFVAVYYLLFSSSARKPMYYYFHNILGFSPVKSYYYIYKNNITFGKVIIDKVALMGGITSKFTFNFENEDQLHEMAENEGGLIISAHLGNWEIAGQLLNRIATKVNIVMLDAEHERIKDLLNKVMTQKSMSVIPIKEDMSHLFKIKEALKKNEIVAIHGDRFLPGSKTITRNFLGQPAKFPSGPFYIAMKYGKPVTYVTAIKESNKHYHFRASKLKLYSNSRVLSERQNLLETMIDDYIKVLEPVLLKHPEQWFNYYYFWD